MTTIIEEIGRASDTQSRRRQYVIEPAAGSTLSEGAALAALDIFAPATVDGLARKDISITELDAEDSYRAEVTWSAREPPENDAEYRFSFAAKSGHIKYAIDQAGFAPAGQTAPDFQLALNVVSDGGRLRVDGLDLPVPAEVFSYSYTMGDAEAGAMQFIVHELAGRINSDSWRDLPAHSTMLVRAAGGKRGKDDWTIDMGFAYQQPQSQTDIGDISLPPTRGFDYVWPYYVTGHDDVANELTMRPKALYVAQVYQAGDFDLLPF